MNELKGRRIHTDGTTYWDGTNIFPFDQIRLGDYWVGPTKDEVHGKTPCGLFCNLSGHDIVWHPNGNLTAHPSIFVKGTIDSDPKEISWHGFLVDGIWKECEDV